MFLTSIIIILTSVIWLKPYTIGWFDTRVNQFFTYEAEDENGNISEISKNELNPYHQWIQYDRFLFLVNKKCLPVSGFGYTHKFSIQNELEKFKPGDLARLEEEYGVNHFDETKAQKFNNFIKTFFNNRNNKNSTNFFLKAIRPPHHLHNSVQGPGLQSLGKIKKFRVIYNFSYNEAGQVRPLIKQIVSEIII